MQRRKLAQLVQVRGAWRIQNPQHQRHGVVTDGYFDLRQPLPDTELRQQGRQRSQQRANWWRKHFAPLELCDIGRKPFAKTHDDAPLLEDIPRAQARTAPVGPDRPAQRLEPRLWRNPRQALEVVPQLGLLGFELRIRGEVLERAAAASSEVCAFRGDACARGYNDFQQFALVMLAVTPDASEANRLARQCARDEGSLAAAYDSLTLVGQRRDRRRFVRRRFEFYGTPAEAQANTSQARRNSAKCGSLPVRSRAFTFSTSSAWRSGGMRPRIRSKRRYSRYVLSTSVSQ